MGSVATALLTGKATYHYIDVIETEKRNYRNTGETSFGPVPDEWDSILTKKQKVLLGWKIYIPAASTGALTIVCIIGANRIGYRRAAAVAAAYSLSERAFTEYREKVVEKLGAPNERAVRDEIAQDQVARHPVSQQAVIFAEDESIFFDRYSGRYFKSTMENVKKAQNDMNFLILRNEYATLTDFYGKIGLDRIEVSDEVGWNHDKQVELEITAMLTDDQRPCIAIGFYTQPIRNYDRLYG